MSRSHLAVLISLIGTGLSWHEAGVAQGTGDAAASQATPARDAAIRNALGLAPSRDDEAVRPASPRPTRSATPRRRAATPTPAPTPEEQPRWDAAALGLDRARRDDVRGPAAASSEDGRIRAIFGFGTAPSEAPALAAARPGWVPRPGTRRDERVETRSEAPPSTPARTVAAAPTEAPLPAAESRAPEAAPPPLALEATADSAFDGREPVTALDRAAPSAYLSPLADADLPGPVGSVALSLLGDGPRPQPRRRGRQDPLPMIAEGSSVATRRGATGNTASLALTSDDLDRAADRLRTPTRDRQDRASADDAADPLIALLQVVPRAGDEPYDSPRRLIASIVERTRDAQVAADVFRHIASDIDRLADERVVDEAMPDARSSADAAIGPVGLASRPATDPSTALAYAVDMPVTETLTAIAARPVGAPVAAASGVAAKRVAGRLERPSLDHADATWAVLPLEATMPEPIPAKAAFVDGLVAMMPATRGAATPDDAVVVAAGASAVPASLSPFERIVTALAAYAPQPAPQPSPLLVRVLDPATPRLLPLPFVPRASWSDALDDAERRAAAALLPGTTTTLADAPLARPHDGSAQRPSMWVDVFDPALDLPRRASRPSTPNDGRRVVATAGLRIDPLAHRGIANHDFGGPMLVALNRLEPAGAPLAAMLPLPALHAVVGFEPDERPIAVERARPAPDERAPRLDPLGGTIVALADARLDAMRGGFETDGGLKVSFGIERAVYVNGNLMTTTSLNVADLGKLSAGQAQAMGLDRATLGIVQSGPNNQFTPGQLNASSVATVIQNTLNDQKIQGITQINATVNSMDMIKRTDLQNRIQGALTDSIRH